MGWFTGLVIANVLDSSCVWM